jgi:hypothetical protein
LKYVVTLFADLLDLRKRSFDVRNFNYALARPNKGILKGDPELFCIERVDLILLFVREVNSLEKAHAIIRLFVWIIRPEEDSVYSKGFIRASKGWLVVISTGGHEYIASQVIAWPF